MNASNPTVAVLATMNTKSKEALFVADVLTRAGARPWIVDLSMKSHGVPGADLTGAQVAEVAGSSWETLSAQTRQEAAAVMIEGGRRILLEKVTKREVSGAIGLGGANGTDLVCSILRDLPYLVPKIVISAVAGTAAVQWCVAESDICMFPSIGDVSLNRVTRVVMENAAWAAAMEAKNWAARQEAKSTHAPLLAVSSFGGTAACVDHVSLRLEALGYEVIQFHASGVGGRSLERMASTGDLAGVVDITTHELADLVAGGVYSAGEGRLTAAGVAGLPQVVVPGAIDHVNFWAGQVLPERYQNREFFRYNAQNLLMRTNAEEFKKLGFLLAQRLNAAKGTARVLIPFEGFSEHTKLRAHDLAGHDRGPWRRPEEYRIFADTLKANLDPRVRVEEFPLHINDARFADACVDAFVQIAKESRPK
ncbi:MAG TPA: Tm-1-like ATP-binding domain-containing protein [Candidatus Dormibacteraeota bacterium]|nr:Tm-1-like ATP-binding domain-containing protein [Candidatus Dormibacteraeota bacterium]